MGSLSRLLTAGLLVLAGTLAAPWALADGQKQDEQQAAQQTITLDKPIPVVASIRRGSKPPENVVGTLTAWNDDSLTIQPKTGEPRSIHWVDLTGNSAFAIRVQVIDKKSGLDWLKMGALIWGLNDTRDARGTLATAARLDPKLKDDVDAVLASGAGILLEGPELLHDADGDSDDDAPLDPKSKYKKASPAQAKAAMTAIRENAKKVSDEMHIDLKELETTHFLIYTDWGPQADQYLKDNLEAAYKVVTAQFEIPYEENVFVGKLGVFMFASQDDFLKFGGTYDHLPNNRGIRGYYAPRGNLLSHLVMFKPAPEAGVSSGQLEQEWAYVLTHEFTHAFVARYRSNRGIPTWLNEGIAEVVASTQFPNNPRLREEIGPVDHQDMAHLFDDNTVYPPAEFYPIMRTVTLTLIRQDGAKFLKMFDELKAGATGARALKDAYGWTFDDLEARWRQGFGVKG